MTQKNTFSLSTNCWVKNGVSIKIMQALFVFHVISQYKYLKVDDNFSLMYKILL